MKCIRHMVFILLIVSVFASSASAEFTVKDYKKLKNSEPMQVYVNGLGKGCVYANTFMKLEMGESVFCTPDKLVLEKTNFIRILDNEIERIESTMGFQTAQDQLIEIILINGLKETFPCDKPK